MRQGRRHELRQGEMNPSCALNPRADALNQNPGGLAAAAGLADP